MHPTPLSSLPLLLPGGSRASATVAGPLPAPPASRASPPSTRRPTLDHPFHLSSPPAPPSRHERHRPPPVPLFALSSRLRPCTVPPPPLPPQCPYPPKATERLWTAPDSARTTPPPAFIGEHLLKLRSFATNHPPTHHPPPPSYRGTPRPSATPVQPPPPRNAVVLRLLHCLLAAPLLE
jgi:hypothetical protein